MVVLNNLSRSQGVPLKHFWFPWDFTQTFPVPLRFHSNISCSHVVPLKHFLFPWDSNILTSNNVPQTLLIFPLKNFLFPWGSIQNFLGSQGVHSPTLLFPIGFNLHNVCFHGRGYNTQTFSVPMEFNNRVNKYRGVKYKCTRAFGFAEG